MLPRSQSMFPTRELYSSNPCRDLWDSQQLSQTGSQACSQQSSSELLSQSRMSQQRFNSLDVWSQPTNSQWKMEDEPVKYYMKYMTQPPLFSSESDRTKPQTTNYREFIELQKKQTAERDNRDVLDNFISLLKDYTKEVKAAMDSFKESIDSTLASKAEQVAMAASQSAELITKLKEDLLEGFGCLKKDLKENQELKEVISKQAEKIAEQGAQIQMLQLQLQDHRNRELKTMEKQEKYLEREDKMLQTLEEMRSRQLPTSKDPPCLTRPLNNPAPEYFEDQRASAQAQMTSAVAVQQYLQACNSVKLHHVVPPLHSAPHLPLTSVHDQSNNQYVPVLGYRAQPQMGSEPVSFSTEHMQCQSQLVYTSQDQPVVYQPTAAIAPMRPVSNASLAPPEEIKAPASTISKDATIPNKPCPEPASLTEEECQEIAFASPITAKSSCLAKGVACHKQSPIAAVPPQIRVKTESEEAPGLSCAKKTRKEDPFDIFVFDLTTSPDNVQDCITKNRHSASAPRPTPKNAVKTYGRIKSSKTTTIMDTDESKRRSTERVSDQESSQSNQQHLLRKVFSLKSTGSNLRSKSTPALTFKLKRNEHTAAKDCGTETQAVGNTPNRPSVAKMEDAIPKAKENHIAAKRTKPVFKRNLGAAKRTLSFDASIFNALEDNVNIHQITESIRKHANRRKAATAV